MRLYLLFFLFVCGRNFCGDFSIGPRIITQKGVWSEQELLLYVDLHGNSLTTLFNGLAYGTTENTGFQITLPIILRDKFNGKSHSGLGSLLLFGQWQFYKQPSNMGIFTAGVRAPTRTIKRSTTEISSAAGYIFDIAGIHSSQNWYAQTRTILLTTPQNHNLKPGNLFFHTLVAGPKIKIRKTTLWSLLALRAIHAQDHKFNGIQIPTGGTVLFLGPQFALQRKNITLGSAFGWPIMQRVDAPNTKFEWFGAALFQIDF